MQVDSALDYIRKIRNEQKRAYAQQYWAWLVETTVIPGSEAKAPEISGISAMAAQSVRQRLAAFST